MQDLKEPSADIPLVLPPVDNTSKTEQVPYNPGFSAHVLKQMLHVPEACADAVTGYIQANQACKRLKETLKATVKAHKDLAKAQAILDELWQATETKQQCLSQIIRRYVQFGFNAGAVNVYIGLTKATCFDIVVGPSNLAGQELYLELAAALSKAGTQILEEVVKAQVE